MEVNYTKNVTIQNLLIFVQYREIFKILLHPY